MSTAKTQRLELRLTEEQNTLIRSAATYTSRSISDFVLSAATLEAERRLADQRFFILNDEDHARSKKSLRPRRRTIPSCANSLIAPRPSALTST